MSTQINISKIRINPLFYISTLICCIFGNPVNFIITYISLIIHELVHLYFLYKEKAEISHITVEPFGICIKTKAMGNISPITFISAPLFNIFISFLFYYSFLKTTNEIFLIASASNLALGLFNLLPVLPFDGGRALMYKLKNKKTAVFFSAFGGILIIVCGIFLFWDSNFNFSLIMTGIFVVANSISENEQIFERSAIITKNTIDKTLTGKMETVIISAPYSYNAHKLISSFNSGKFHIVNIIKDGVVLGSVTETLIIDGILKGKTILQDFL